MRVGGDVVQVLRGRCGDIALHREGPQGLPQLDAAEHEAVEQDGHGQVVQARYPPNPVVLDTGQADARDKTACRKEPWIRTWPCFWRSPRGRPSP